MMVWLVSDPSFSKLLVVLLLYSVYFGLYNGALIPLLAEIMPVEVRTAAFSLAFVTATAIFGGFTPAICTYLIQLTGNRAVPGLWLSFAAVCGLVAALVARAQPVERPQSLRESYRSAAESISLPQM
jgi:MHS family citrate/tricarballylate:H+ symporter-like MFS transporter